MHLNALPVIGNTLSLLPFPITLTELLLFILFVFKFDTSLTLKPDEYISSKIALSLKSFSENSGRSSKRLLMYEEVKTFGNFFSTLRLLTFLILFLLK